jgi:hypothetical protein
LKAAPFYTRTHQFPAVYHNNAECRDGNSIKREHKLQGTGGRRLCKWCATHDRDLRGLPGERDRPETGSPGLTIAHARSRNETRISLS